MINDGDWVCPECIYYAKREIDYIDESASPSTSNEVQGNESLNVENVDKQNFSKSGLAKMLAAEDDFKKEKSQIEQLITECGHLLVSPKIPL